MGGAVPTFRGAFFSRGCFFCPLFLVSICMFDSFSSEMELLRRVQLTLQEIRLTPYGTSRLVQAMPA